MDREFVFINHLPMPPTGNHRYIPIRTKSKGRISPIKGNGMRLIKAPEFRFYDERIDIWILRNQSFLSDLKSKINKWISIGSYLEVEIDFYFPLDKIVSKKNEIKKLDIDGRFKTILDVISKLIGVDDKWIVRTVAQKPRTQQLFEEHVSVIIKPIQWSSLQTLKERNDGLLLSNKVIK